MDRGRGRGRGGPDRGRGASRGSSGSRGSSPEAYRGGRGSSPESYRGGRGSPDFTRGGRGRGGSQPPAVFSPGLVARIDSRYGKEAEDFAAKLRKLDIGAQNEDNKRVIRPGFGKKGVEFAVRANFFQFDYAKNTVLYDYAIEINPPVKLEEKRLRKRLFALFDQSPAVQPFFNGIAHDGAQRIIACRPLPPTFGPIDIPFFEEGQDGPREGGKTYTISVVLPPKELLSTQLDSFLNGNNPGYDPLPIVSAFNLVTTAYATRTAVLFGKNRYFYPPTAFQDDRKPLSAGLEAWKGFYTSVRPVYKNLMVNVNVCMSAFYSPHRNFAEAWLEFSNASYGSNPQAYFFYRRVRVITRHLGYPKRSTVKSIGASTARRTTFQCEELGGKVSVEQYFLKKYKITLKYADNVPVLNLGNKTKDVFVPMEVCEIYPGQSYTGPLSERETANMITFACKKPFENAQDIVGHGLTLLGLQQLETPMKDFGVRISTEMAVVPARLLPTPRLMYGSGPQGKVDNGFWNIVNIKFQKPAPLSRVAVVVLADRGRDDFQGPDDPALREILDGLLNKCRSCGMAVDDANRIPPPIYINVGKPDQKDPRRQALMDQVESRVKQLPGKPGMILVFMSSRDNDIYPGFKKLFDTKLGVPSLCMLMPKVRKERGQDQYFSNIALKLNAKLGGLNHKLDAGSLKWLKGTMLVGMDVTHPAIGCVKGTQSIAAVVASYDENFMQYPASLRLQEYRVEMIQHVKVMMIERLQEYSNRNKSLPERILVFRDGVSEGQFDLVMKHELPAIKEALKAMKCTAKLSIAICGKRHHTRFYPTKLDDADRTSNTKAGTVVDKGVTSVYDFDFYLQAHSGLQGTVRSTHYSVIYDENKFPVDEIQQGINDLSYLWARATRSVSLVPPAYWADRACERARMYLHGIYPPLENSPEKKFDEKKIIETAVRLWGNGVHENLRSTMFYL